MSRTDSLVAKTMAFEPDPRRIHPAAGVAPDGLGSRKLKSSQAARRGQVSRAHGHRGPASTSERSRKDDRRRFLYEVVLIDERADQPPSVDMWDSTSRRRPQEREPLTRGPLNGKVVAATLTDADVRRPTSEVPASGRQPPGRRTRGRQPPGRQPPERHPRERLARRPAPHVRQPEGRRPHRR